MTPVEVAPTAEWNEHCEAVSPWLAHLWTEHAIRPFLGGKERDPRLAWLPEAAGIEIGTVRLRRAVRLSRGSGGRLGVVDIELPIAVDAAGESRTETVSIVAVLGRVRVFLRAREQPATCAEVLSGSGGCRIAVLGVDDAGRAGEPGTKRAVNRRKDPHLGSTAAKQRIGLVDAPDEPRPLAPQPPSLYPARRAADCALSSGG